jgi:pimeloyl-ACP methyl ester carboxylesterase
MVAEAKYIEANGLKIFYEVHGEGEPSVLIHGGIATSQAWASHLPAFTEHFRVFAPDNADDGSLQRD